jgi:dihydroorotate dehydrogenase subfamily 2
MIKCGHFLGRFGLSRGLFKIVFRYNNSNYLSQTINGVEFENPIGLSAGFDKNAMTIDILPSIGFAFAEIGSVTLKPSEGNPKPHYRRLKKSKSILVYAGLNNDGIKVFTERVKSYKSSNRSNMRLDISVAKTNSPDSCTEKSGIEDYIGSLKLIKNSNIGDQITINISCPNAYGGEPFTTPEKLDKLIKQVAKLKINKPIYLKMPIDQEWSLFKKLVDVAIKYNITGLKIGNLAKDRKKAKLLDELPSDVPGNMSGKPTYDLSNELISNTYKYAGGKIIIVGVGGIFNAQDAYEKIKRGSNLLEIITGMIYEGPQIIGQINKELVELLKKDGYSHISQAIGSDYKK